MSAVDFPRVSRIKTSMPLDEMEAFDMMSRFLASEKAKQLSLDFAGQAFLTSSTQTWNDLRLACNSLLDENDSRREPVAPWKDETTSAVLPTPSTKAEMEESDDEDSPAVKQEIESPPSTGRSDKKERKAAKKAKKEAKKAKKEAKKAKKEKKRKRDADE